MKQLIRTTISIGCVSAMLGFASLAPAAAPQSRPNILLIIGDDMGYSDVGFHGCKDIPTPNLDALAASGEIGRAHV